MKEINSKITICLIFFAFCIIFLFNGGIVKIADKDFFNGFQRDSESLVVGKILADTHDISIKSNLGRFSKKEKVGSRQSIVNMQYTLLSEENMATKDFSFHQYRSQFGLQGVFFGTFSELTGSQTLLYMHAFCAILFAFVVICMAIEYNKFSTPFAICFLLSIGLSPWVTAFARNLYWVPFTWFLPALFSLYLLKNIGTRTAYIYILLIFIAFMIKCLCGYEYISSIILFAALPFVMFALTPKEFPRSTYIKYFFIVCLLGISGFIVALVLHASIRGDTISDGLQTIYLNDVLRRTYGNVEDFHSVYHNSLMASPLTVISTYIFKWRTNVFAYFPFITCLIIGFILPISSFVLRKLMDDTSYLRDAILYLYALSIPFSWFILAKGHSYVHTHMNYVLWYLGFFPVCLYLIYIFATNKYLLVEAKRLSIAIKNR